MPERRAYDLEAGFVLGLGGVDLVVLADEELELVAGHGRHEAKNGKSEDSENLQDERVSPCCPSGMRISGEGKRESAL